MAFQIPMTIKEVVSRIHTKRYLLPAIQREFVWSTDQIEVLFDSLMRGYPISSFLFWNVPKKKTLEFKFYEFIRDYNEFDNKHNPKANLSGEDDIIAILDGQQRLTSLYIGLKGSYSYKLPRKRYDNKEAYPERKLYLNILRKLENEELEYDFRFLTTDEAGKNDINNFWFPVSSILDLAEEYKVNTYLIQNGLMQLEPDKASFANEALFRLHSMVHRNPIINYYLEESDKLNKVLNIFIRVNSGGTKLSYSDLLLSIATAQWEQKDAREEIIKFVDEINSIGDGFNFDKDFVLKASLVLCNFKNIAFNIDNFNNENMLIIEQKWNEITKSIRLAVVFIASLGYNRETLIANNALIPIAYYLLKIGMPDNFALLQQYKASRSNIHKWLVMSLLKRVFGSHPENLILAVRQIMTDNTGDFPLAEIIDKLRGTEKSILFNDDEIENLFSISYGQKYVFPTLSLLYPTLDFRNKFHLDHIFPKSIFTRAKLEKMGLSEEDILFYLNNVNTIANLQLLEGIPNQQKSDTNFKEWLEKTFSTDDEKKDYMKKHFIPDIDLTQENFKEFITERKELMRRQFHVLLM